MNCVIKMFLENQKLLQHLPIFNTMEQVFDYKEMSKQEPIKAFLLEAEMVFNFF